MTDDERFEAWWQQVASPRVMSNWFTARHADEIKGAFKECWNARANWQPPKTGEAPK